MLAFRTIFGADYVARYEYKITSPGEPERGPTYACGGTPAAPMEFEVTVMSLHEDSPSALGPSLEIPAWLREEIEDHLMRDDDVYEAIVESEREREDEDCDNRNDRDNERISDET